MDITQRLTEMLADMQARLARVEADAAADVDKLKRQLAAERARNAELEAALGDLVGRMADVEEDISDAAWNELSPLAEQAERVLRNVTPLPDEMEEDEYAD